MKKPVNKCGLCGNEMTFCPDCSSWICTDIDCEAENNQHFMECSTKLDEVME